MHCECSLNPYKSMPKPIPTSAVSGFVLGGTEGAGSKKILIGEEG